MAVADLTREGVAISTEQRAHQMLCRCGLTEDRITQVYTYVSATHGMDQVWNPIKIQEAILRFYDEPWDVTRREGMDTPVASTPGPT
eukprot:15446320-Alexandrium_andersonii.AAC.1